jgi:hypothetical protein
MPKNLIVVAARTVALVFSVSVVILFAVGCSSDLFNGDDEALDRFSHAYTEFRDTGEVTEATWQAYLGTNIDSTGFFTTLQEALNLNSVDESRLRMAQSGIDSYDQLMPIAFGKMADQINQLDHVVGQLFETANAIKDQPYREDAVQIAKYAREAEAAVALGENLVEQRLRLQRQALSDIVNADGSFARALQESALVKEGDEVVKITEEINAAAEKSTAAMQNLKDTFSALKGKTNLRAYPTKDELRDEKTNH